MNYQKFIFVGNATQDAKRRTSKDGTVSFVTFRVGVANGKERSVFFPVTVFGKHGEAIADYVTKGREVLVEGRIDVSADGRHNVVADSVRLGAQAGEPRDAGATETPDTP